MLNLNPIFFTVNPSVHTEYQITVQILKPRSTVSSVVQEIQEPENEPIIVTAFWGTLTPVRFLQSTGNLL
jgi:hypothetical protein